jgi:hypothetical protein
MLKRNGRVDPTLAHYLGSILGSVLNLLLVLAILQVFGVQTTSFAALLAGLGLAIGTAWGGLLAHFAAGVFMQVLRPFKVGDFVTAGGVTGTVQELGLFGTTIITPDNVTTIVGNNKIFSDTISNYSALPVRRVELTAKIANGVDPIDAANRLREAVVKIPNVVESCCVCVRMRTTATTGRCTSIRIARSSRRSGTLGIRRRRHQWCGVRWVDATARGAALSSHARHGCRARVHQCPASGLRGVPEAASRRRVIFHTAPSATGTTAAPIPTSTITFRYWRINGILPKK